MPRIPGDSRIIPRYLTHDPVFFGEKIRGVGACLHCGARVDQRTREERCLRREDYVDWSGNPFRPDGTH